MLSNHLPLLFGPGVAMDTRLPAPGGFGPLTLTGGEPAGMGMVVMETCLQGTSAPQRVLVAVK